jgi:hypothetical protein
VAVRSEPFGRQRYCLDRSHRFAQSQATVSKIVRLFRERSQLLTQQNQPW